MGSGYTGGSYMLDLNLHLLHMHYGSKRQKHKGNKKEKPCKLDGWAITIVVGSSHVLNLQHPFSTRVLIPGVGGHESPVIEALRGVIVRSERERDGMIHLTDSAILRVLSVWMHPLQSLTWVQAVWSGCPVGWSGRWPGFLCGCRTGWAGLEHVLMSSQSCLSRHMHPHSDWSPNYSQYS